MSTLPVDPQLALGAAAQQDLVRRKLEVDTLRRRLGDGRTKEQELRDACEGFEAVFLQKMWEQMRKTVPKEGYLHSKDEEMYQSLFDVELSKKMASSGGIGLADMLYEQLSQQLEDTGRTTSPGAYRIPLSMPVATGPEAAPAGTVLLPGDSPAADEGELTAQDLYTEFVPQEHGAADADGPESEFLADTGLQEPFRDFSPVIASALEDLEKELLASPLEDDLAAVVAPVPAAQAPARPERERPGGLHATSWQGPGPISITPRPFNRQAGSAPDREELWGRAPGVPPETLWPLEGPVARPFGWYQDAAGQRRWNGGVEIAAASGAPVRACLDGTVIFAGEREGYGHLVVLEHANDLRSYYGNIHPTALAAGDRVKRGMEFASVSTHLVSEGDPENSALFRFELRRGEMALNPESLLGGLITAGR